MNKSALKFIAFLPAVLALATSGCATKTYVRQQIVPVEAKVTTVNQDQPAGRQRGYRHLACGREIRVHGRQSG